jgi:hypothetical protein
VVLAITTAVVGIVFAVAYAVGALVAFIADHAAIIAGGLAVAAILSYLATAGGRTGKRHCPGC